VTYTANTEAVKGYEINPSGLLFSLSKVTVGE
jgi:peptide/nickel transport system substrate-binding protein